MNIRSSEGLPEVIPIRLDGVESAGRLVLEPGHTAWFSELHDSAILDALPPTERRAVREQISREMATAVAVLGWLTIPVTLLLANLDLMRWRAGYFDPARNALAPYFLATMGAHLAFGAALIPAITIWRLRRRRGVRSFRRLQAVHVWLMGIGVLGMALIAVKTRTTSHDLTVAVVLGNLLYHLPRRGRLLWNGVVVAVAVAMVVQTARATADVVEPAVRLVEVAGIGLVALIGGFVVRRQRIRALLSEYRLGRLALIDGLTHVATRRQVEELAAVALAEATPATPLSVLLLDIDDFKSVNDTFGHNVGDEVLRGVARVLRRRVRSDDVLGRWGGEEFIILCPATPVDGAMELAEVIRGQVAAQTFEQVGRRTASIGVAEAASGEALLEVVARADAALYEAKRSGRNRVCVAARSGV